MNNEVLIQYFRSYDYENYYKVSRTEENANVCNVISIETFNINRKDINLMICVSTENNNVPYEFDNDYYVEIDEETFNKVQQLADKFKPFVTKYSKSVKSLSKQFKQLRNE